MDDEIYSPPPKQIHKPSSPKPQPPTPTKDLVLDVLVNDKEKYQIVCKSDHPVGSLVAKIRERIKLDTGIPFHSLFNVTRTIT